LVQSSLRKLRDEAREAGKAELFDALSAFIAERPDDADYERVAARFGMRRNTLAVAVHRMRHRLHTLIREQLADTAANADDLDMELRELGQSFDMPM
jgi:RNA polymerase sigma-70 factor (ECF subfamily)